MNIKKVISSSVCGLFCFLTLLLYGGYSFIKYTEKYLLFLQETKPKILNMFQNDKDILQINKKGLLLRNNSEWCLIYSQDTSKICGQKIKKYSEILKKIPDDHEFYSCENNWLIEQISSTRYYVWIPYSKKKIINGNQDGTWLSFGYPFNKKENIDPCYPWNDLEDYWKRYGKASPESIQAVINKGTP